MSALPAFALLHGGGQGSWVWDETALALRDAGARVLALDVPGCGTKRGRDIAALGVDAIANELLGDLAAAGMDEVVPVGHSAAGKLLPRMAEREPARFRHLIYVACIAPPPGRSILDQMGRGKQGDHPDEVGRPLDPATTKLADQHRAMFCNDMDEAAADTFLARLGEDHWPMATLTSSDWRYDHLAGVPSTYIVCDRDQALPPVWQARFAEQFRVDRVVHLDAGHQAMNTQPEALAKLLLEEGRATRSRSP